MIEPAEQVPPVPTSTEMAEHRTNLADARSHLANERTHLAYLRTALSMMSFGITINRFAIYLLQGQNAEKLLQHQNFPMRDAANVGLGMVIIGMVLLLWSLVRYRKTYKQIVEQRFQPSSTSVSLLTLAVVGMGAVSAIWLLLN